MSLFLWVALVTIHVFPGPAKAAIWYINDASTVGDVYTTAAGNSANDGATTNTPKRFLNDVEGLLAAGDTVYVDAGTYLEPDTFRIAASSIWIIGADSTATVIDFNDSSFANQKSIFAETVAYLTIRDLRVTRGRQGIRWNNVDSSIVTRVRIDQCGQQGFLIEGGSESNTFVNCLAASNSGEGFYLNGPRNLLTGNRAASNGYYGFDFAGVTNSTITQSTASNNANFGFWFGGASNNSVSFNLAESSQVNGGFGIAGAGNNTVWGNSSRGNIGDGFFVDSVVASIFSGNVALNNAGGAGFRFVRTEGSTITQNATYDNLSSGFRLMTTSRNNVVSNNSSESNGSSGFAFESGSDSNLLSENTSLRNAIRGFLFQDVHNQTASGNRSERNAQGGYALIASNGNRLFDNISREDSGAGSFAIWPGTDNRLHQNTADSPGTWAFYIDTSAVTGNSSGNILSKNNYFASPYRPDSAVYSNEISGVDFTRNWWGTVDSAAIRAMIGGAGRDSVVTAPFRLGPVDTAAGADTVAPAAPDTVTVDPLGLQTLGAFAPLVSWSTVTAHEEPSAAALGLAGYRIYRAETSAASTWTTVATVTPSINSYLDTGVAGFGDYYYRVTSFDDHLAYSNESFFSDSVAHYPVGVVLVSPANGAVTAATRPLFQWTAMAGTAALQVSTVADFSSLYDVQAPTTSTYAPAADYPAGTYHWRVSVTRADGFTDTASASFTIDPAAAGVVVQVRNETGLILPNAEVWVFRNGAVLAKYSTNETGYVSITGLVPGDSLYAAWNTGETVPTAKPFHPDSAAGAYFLHSRFTRLVAVDVPRDTVITVDRRVLRARLVVVLEWEASPTELDGWTKFLKKMSNHLLDATDGQFTVDTFYLRDNKEHWRGADVRVFAAFSPSVSGLGRFLKFSGAGGDNISFGKYFNRLYIQNAADPAAKAMVLVHEFSHYAFGVPDEYNECGKYCTVDIQANIGKEHNACLMQFELDADEFCNDANHNHEIRSYNCSGAPIATSCWKTLQGYFPWVEPPAVVDPGPNLDVAAAVELTGATIANNGAFEFDLLVTGSDGSGISNAPFFLRKNDLGLLDLGDKGYNQSATLSVRSAKNGDTLLVFANGYDSGYVPLTSAAAAPAALTLAKTFSVPFSAITVKDGFVRIKKAAGDLPFALTVAQDLKTTYSVVQSVSAGSEFAAAIPHDPDFERGHLIIDAVRTVGANTLHTWFTYSYQTMGLFSSTNNLLEGTGFSIFIPAGAFAADDTLTVSSFTLTDTGDVPGVGMIPGGPAVSLELDQFTGAAFAQSVALRLSFDPTIVAASTAAAYKLNPQTEQWVYVGGVPNEDQQMVTVSLDTFSIYAVFGRPFSAVAASLDADAVRVFPNPFVPYDGDPENGVAYDGTANSGIFISGLVANTEIEIYDIQGRLVDEMVSTGAGAVQWDARNTAGREVVSGTYYIVISDRATGQRLVKKLAIVR